MANYKSVNALTPREIDIYDSFDKRKHINSPYGYDDMSYYHDSGRSTLKINNDDLDPRLGGYYSFLNSKSPMPVKETSLNTVKLNGTDITGKTTFILFFFGFLFYWNKIKIKMNPKQTKKLAFYIFFAKIFKYFPLKNIYMLETNLVCCDEKNIKISF